MSRVLMSYFASVYVRFITRIGIRDWTAGFMCYRRKVLETITQYVHEQGLSARRVGLEELFAASTLEL